MLSTLSAEMHTFVWLPLLQVGWAEEIFKQFESSHGLEIKLLLFHG
jgi:hypothetical protein